MGIQDILLTLLNNGIQVVAACAITFIQRWLLGFSTYEKDKATFQKTRLYYLLNRLSWYRGREFFHQIRGTKLLKDA